MHAYLMDCLCDAMYKIENPQEIIMPSESSSVYEVTDIIPDKLSTIVAYWTQYSPYNKFCGMSATGGYNEVGCVPLSTGMLLSYYQWPKGTNYPGTIGTDKYNFQWDNILSASTDPSVRLTQTAEMLGYLRNTIFKSTTSEIYPGSGTSLMMMGAWYTKLGFKDERVFNGAPMKDNQSKVYEYLKNGTTVNNQFCPAAPVLVYGVNDTVVVNDGPIIKGHQWVIDGAVKRGIVWYINGNRTVIPALQTIYFRCVWGTRNRALTGYFRYINSSDYGDPKQYLPFQYSPSSPGAPVGDIEFVKPYTHWRVNGGLWQN